MNVIESRGSSFSGRGWEEVVAIRDEEEEAGECSVCGRDVVYGLRGRGMGGLPAVEKAAAGRKWCGAMRLRRMLKFLENGDTVVTC